MLLVPGVYGKNELRNVAEIHCLHAEERSLFIFPAGEDCGEQAQRLMLLASHPAREV